MPRLRNVLPKCMVQYRESKMLCRSTILIAAAVLIAGSHLSFAQTTCAQFATIPVNGGEYNVQTNEWNSSAQQCLSINGPSFTITQANFNLPTNGPPATYPSIYKGCHWGTCTTNSGLPLQASSIGTANATFAITPASGNWDAAFDIWFNQTPSTNGQPNGTEVMIWANHQGPPQPFGSRVGSVTIDGSNWDVWVGNEGWNVISYVQNPVTNSVTLDLKPFFADAEARQQLQPGWWLISIEAGFEVWDGGQGLAVNSYSVNVSQSGSTGGGGGTGGSTGSGPTITSINPPSAAAGGPVTINGSNFGSSAGKVTMGGVQASIGSWSNTAITATVPNLAAGSQNVIVFVPSNAAPLSIGSPSSGCHVDYSITNSWSGGFQAAVNIKNTGSSGINGWTLTWNFAGDQQITNLWNGALSQNGQSVAVRNVSYNASIPAGSTYSGIGFVANVTGTNAVPVSFSLNGVQCN